MAFHLTEDVLDLALEHLVVQGDTDILPPAFEVDVVKSQWEITKRWLLSEDLDTWTTRPLRRCLSPKQRLGLRIATQLDPIDTLLTTAVVLMAGEALEAVRLSADDLIVHSHRFAPELPHGRLYSPDFTFRSFRAHSVELASTLGGYVLLTDISDFYPRLYSHRLENTLDSALAQVEGTARITRKFLSQWNQGVSYGLPVGPAAFRLLAEVTINDVDQALRAKGYTFCRFSDDYRVFVGTERQAHEALAYLANTLLRNHGLSLQEAKTEIIAAETFVTRFSKEEDDQAADALHSNFERLLDEVGIDTYDLVSMDELSPEVVTQIEKANLWQVLSDELRSEQPNYQMVRFALRQIGNAGLPNRDSLILDSIELLIASFPEAIRAATASPSMTEEEMLSAAGRLLDLIDGSNFGHLEYFRAWVLHVFRDSADWNHVPHLLKVYDTHPDSFTRSAATLALGVGQADYWFRGRRDELGVMGPWERRAFLAGAACLPKDERNHWYSSVRPGLDRLEQAVVEWARATPQGTRKAAPTPEPVEPDEEPDGWSKPAAWDDDFEIPF
jgi:hypothetical protein